MFPVTSGFRIRVVSGAAVLVGTLLFALPASPAAAADKNCPPMSPPSTICGDTNRLKGGTTRPNVVDPDVAINQRGDSIAVYTSFGARQNDAVMAQRFSAGVPVGVSIAVFTATNFRGLGAPSVGIDGAGNFIVASSRISDDGTSTSIVGQRFSAAGGRLGSEFRIDAERAGNTPQNARVSVAANGFAAVSWSNRGPTFTVGNPGGQSTVTTAEAAAAAAAGLLAGLPVGLQVNISGIHVQRFDATGRKRGGTVHVIDVLHIVTNLPPLSLLKSYEVDDPAIGVDDAGRLVVVWHNQDEVILGQRFDALGLPAGFKFLASPGQRGLLGGGAGGNSSPRLAVNGSGQFVVVFEASNDTVNGIGAHFYDAKGRSLGDAFQVNGPATGGSSAFSPSVAIDGRGEAVVVWEHDDGLLDIASHIHGQQFLANASRYGGEFQIDDINPLVKPALAVLPKVSMNPASGDFATVWQQYFFSNDPVESEFRQIAFFP